ncbi:MAG: tetratricopeptide repeat protein [Bryobacterales bacterium]|nr:tetratricopeptide repeat protein [Bryobacteraceae bacterium]MDW8355821.1 tetratricopeptide repeat protein [Bryobacterales bacterium]
MKKAVQVLVWFLALTGASLAAASAASTERQPNRAEAYYHYAMGHLYAELGTLYGNRGEYFSRAIEHYKEAIKADPGAGFLAEELSEVYVQSGRLNEAVTEAEERLRQNPDALDARRLLGRLYMRLIGDPQNNRINETMLRKAIEQYEKVAEKDPRSIETWLVLGRLYKVAQNSVEAEKAYKRALELDSDSEEAMTGLAMVYSDVGDHRRAVEMLERVVQANPNLRTLASLAGAYEQMRDYKGAAGVLKRALELAPDNPELKRALAQNLALSHQLDAAIGLYEDLTRSNPKDVLAWLRLSQVYRQKRDLPKARHAIEQAKQLAPDNLEIRYHEVSLVEAEGKHAEAIQLVQAMLDEPQLRSRAPLERAHRAVLLERLGQLYRSNLQYPEAVAAFGRMAELDPDLGPRAAAQIVETWRQAKEYAKAAEEAEAAHKKYPQDRMVAMVRASILADLGKADQAVAAVKRFLDGKADREIWIALAQVYERTKNYAEMGKALDAAEKLSDSDDDRQTIYFLRGAMFERMKNYDAAEAQFRKVLELDPENASALNYLGYMLADRNVRLAEAHELIAKAVEIEPHNGAYLDSLGWVYFRMDRLEEAEKYLRKALERVPRDPTVNDHLGDVLARQGRWKEAIAQWSLALKEWEASAPSEYDAAEVAKIQKKLEGARVRLAKEAAASAPRR